MLFLTSHLSEILQLLTDPAGEWSRVTVYHCLYYSTIEGGTSDSMITEEDVAALDLLIGGSTDNERICSIASLATMQSELSKSGYSKVSI